MPSLDQILNFGIPALLILSLVAFVWMKLLGPWLGPILQNFWAYLKGENQPHEPRYSKEIIYE